mgnify:CR=1 FL=1
MHDETTTTHAHIIAVMLYASNCPTQVQVESLFPGSHPTYHEKHRVLIRADFCRFWHGLDEHKQREYVSLALDSYSDEAHGSANLAFISSAV